MSQQGATVLEPATLLATVDAARAAADRAATDAGIRIAIAGTLDELVRAAAVWQRVWGPDDEPPVPTDVLRALAHSGNYVAVAYDGELMVGALLGFFGGDAEAVDHLHSHILGVDVRAHGRGVGYALKLHQRHWALQRGIDRITWTYDPLVRRNGYFNLVKLGAQSVEYLVDFYGAMLDAINDGDRSDRILVGWDLFGVDGGSNGLGLQGWVQRGAAVALDVASDGVSPVVKASAADVLLCATPPDIIAMRRSHAAIAHEWRSALREVMLASLRRGLSLHTMTRDGWYVFTAPAVDAEV